MVVTRFYAREIRLRLAQSLQRLFCPLSLGDVRRATTNSTNPQIVAKTGWPTVVDVFNRAVGKNGAAAFIRRSSQFKGARSRASLNVGFEWNSRILLPDGTG